MRERRESEQDIRLFHVDEMHHWSPASSIMDGEDDIGHGTFKPSRICTCVGLADKYVPSH